MSPSLARDPRHITVVVPSYRPGPAIRDVLENIDRGLDLIAPRDAVIAVIDSSPPEFQDFIGTVAAKLRNKTECIFHDAQTHKGEAIFEGFRLAAGNRSTAIVMLDADLRSMVPEWLPALVNGVVQGFEFVTPRYSRHKNDGIITNLFAYPLLAAAFGTSPRQPIGGDFALSGAALDFYLSQPDVPDDALRFGIDIWLTSLALAHGLRIAEAPLGAKVHNNRIGGPDRPERSMGPMLVEVVTSSFEVLSRLESERAHANVRLVSSPVPARAPVPVYVDGARYAEASRRLYPQEASRLRELLPPELVSPLEDFALNNGSVLSSRTWASVVANALRAFGGDASFDKRSLVASLIPPYFARVASFLAEIEPCAPQDVERAVSCQVADFARALEEAEWRH